MQRYGWAIAVAGTAALAWSWWQYGIEQWTPVLMLIVLNALTESYAVGLPIIGSVSLSFAVTYAALLHSGPTAAALCAIAGSTTLREHKEGKPYVLRAFNAGQLTLAAVAAGVMFDASGGQIIAEGGAITAGFGAAVVAAASFFAVNVVLVAIAASTLTGRRLGSVLADEGFLSFGVSLIALGFLGIVLAELLHVRSWLGMSILVLPFIAARRTFRASQELQDAYSATVRSLVAAIEAKDPYTRGHSERVADYARRLTQAIGGTEPEAIVAERAGLLHDIGKIGIAKRTLTSTARLGDDEVRSIREHPALGGRVLKDVEFLGDVLPIIHHHHERVDGAGYPDGLSGEAIPLLARILAAADAYDAMTSDRAYRGRLTHEAARAEMMRVSGTQLDQSVVQTFFEKVLDVAVEPGAS
jgi:hypothetical protein